MGVGPLRGSGGAGGETVRVGPTVKWSVAVGRGTAWAPAPPVASIVGPAQKKMKIMRRARAGPHLRWMTGGANEVVGPGCH